MPYRIAAPPPPEPADVEDPYAAVLRWQRRRAHLASAALIVFLAGGIAAAATSSKPAVRQNAAVFEGTRVAGASQAIEAARMRAVTAQTRFETGVREAIGEDAGPRPDLGACPVQLPPRLALTRGRAAFPLLMIERAGVHETLPSQAVAGVLADVRRAEAHLAAGRIEEAALYARALDRTERFGYDVVFVARAAKPPRALAGNTFEPGEFEGRAYLFDFASGRVVCAGDVLARSSKEIGYVYSDRNDTPPSLGPAASLGEAIADDIRLETERAIVAAVEFRSGPPITDPLRR